MGTSILDRLPPPWRVKRAVARNRWLLYLAIYLLIFFAWPFFSEPSRHDAVPCEIREYPGCPPAELVESVRESRALSSD